MKNNLWQATIKTLEEDKGLFGFCTGLLEGIIVAHILPTVLKKSNSTSGSDNSSETYITGGSIGFFGTYISYVAGTATYLLNHSSKPYFLLLPIATNFIDYTIETGIKIKKRIGEEK